MKVENVKRIAAMLLILVPAAVSALLTSGCNRGPSWSGEFTGLVIERVERRDHLYQLENAESKTSQNTKVTVSKGGKGTATLSFGDCILELNIYDRQPDSAYAREGQTCKVSVNGFQENLVLHGDVTQLKDSIKFLFVGESKKEDKSLIYTYDFSGDAK
jgi:hypothetical protein